MQTVNVNENIRPWVVLVTGLNGIRKTTTVSQPWFKNALLQSLKTSKEQYNLSNFESIDPNALPDGSSSFFRQLDYMIATIANEDFKLLYLIESAEAYSFCKDAIFSRYRTLAESLGVLLLKEAIKQKLNIFVETSGKDVAMYEYIDYFISKQSPNLLKEERIGKMGNTEKRLDEFYHKLVVHFEINNIKFAEESVDKRMENEMKLGRKALSEAPCEIIKINAGGPYGSSVLGGVKKDSDKVWTSVKDGLTAQCWFKANFKVVGDDEKPWYVKVNTGESNVDPDTTDNRIYTFL